MKYQNLYSETTGKQPSASAVEIGEIWVNIKDSILGTKNSSGAIVPFAQLTKAERTKLQNINLSKYIPTSGTISKSTMEKATAASTSFTINDSSASVIELTSANNLTATITVNKTTGYKVTTVVVKKPIGKTVALTFSGVDSWISDTPVFSGTSTKIEYLILQFATNANWNCATVIVNTQNPITATVAWGSITGTLTDQADLKTALGNKADSSTVTALTKTVNAKANSADVTKIQTTLQTDIDTRALKKDLESAVTSLNKAITRITALETKLTNVTNANGALNIAQTVNIT